MAKLLRAQDLPNDGQGRSRPTLGVLCMAHKDGSFVCVLLCVCEKSSLLFRHAQKSIHLMAL